MRKFILFFVSFLSSVIITFAIDDQLLFSELSLRDSKNILLLIDPDSGYILDSSMGAKTFYKYENLNGMNISQINTLKPEEIKNEMQKAKEEQRNYFHFKHLTKDKDIKEVYVTSYPMKKNKNTLLLSVVSDVSDDIMKERKLNFLKLFSIIFLLLTTLSTLYLLKKIKEKEKRYSDLFNNMSEAIIIYERTWDQEKNKYIKKCTSVNPYFERLTGIDSSSAIGKCVCDIFSAFDSTLIGTIDKFTASSQSLSFKHFCKQNNCYYKFHAFTTAKNQFALAFTDITTEENLKEQLKIEKLKAEELATHDFLTKLPNRFLLRDRVENGISIAQRNSTNIAVCIIDLDGFKLVNDTYGHMVGDQLLIEISKRIKTSLRDFDTLSRFGGDEFVCLLTNFSGQTNCEIIVERIIASAKEPIQIHEINIKPSFSIGVACYPDDGNTYEDLLRNADSALYEAKSQGKNRYVFYNKYCLLSK